MQQLRVGVLYSGGKDSTFAAYTAKQQGHQLACLITMMPDSPESYLFHYPNIRWTELAAQTMNVPIMKTKTCEVGESEIQDLATAVNTAKEQYALESIVTGGLASRYQKQRFETVCAEAGLKHFSPFWLKDPETYMRNIIRSDFSVILVSVAAEGLDKSWLGRAVNESMIDELKELNRRLGVHIAFEGGEAETFVLDCPLFTRSIEILGTETHWSGDHGFMEIKDARLVAKA